MNASLCAYVAWLAVLAGAMVTGAVLWSGGEDDIPTTGARPTPWIDRIEGLRLEANASRPAVSAARAVPSAGGSFVVLGGTVANLELESVAVELADDLELRAEHGEVDADRLRVAGNVRVVAGDERLLTAAGAEFVDGGVRFAGIVVFHPGSERHRTEVDARLTLAELIAAVR